MKLVRIYEKEEEKKENNLKMAACVKQISIKL